MRFVRLTTAAGAREPVSIEDVRDFGRIVGSTEDRVLEQLILSARQEVERYTGHVLVPGTFRISLDSWSYRLELPLKPVRSVTSVTYQYIDGTSYVVDASTYYADIVASPARLVFSSYYDGPYALRGSGGIELEVVGGYETRADVPEDIRQHVITLALLGYQHRDDPNMLDRVRRYAADGASAFSVVTL
jgi:uncharacterized phiE125 gp8 family phage protein